MNTIAMLVLAYGMQGYYCENHGTKYGEMHFYDKGVQYLVISAMPHESNFGLARFGKFAKPSMKPSMKPSIKADPGMKCYALVPLN